MWSNINRESWKTAAVSWRFCEVSVHAMTLQRAVVEDWKRVSTTISRMDGPLLQHLGSGLGM